MAASFFFYDLETSGFNPREARVMQFAGQRTDMDLKPIGEPHNYLIKVPEDVLPEPDAVLVTGITPQQTLQDGLSEAEFLKIFHEQIAVKGTIFVGFNTVRFDDEFMRYLNYRNYYDPYEWQWSDERSRWDLLDLVRMTRALRPDGINWPFDEAGKPVNKLELLAAANNLEHESAHDALSDVQASIALARLLKTKQPKLFEFLLSIRDKKAVAQLVRTDQPLVYSSGRFAAEFEKTTVVGVVGDHPGRNGATLVFDLRYDPRPFLELDPPALAEAWRRRKDDPGPRLPVKTMQHNRCPAIAPLNVLDAKSQKRLKLDPKIFMKNFEALLEVRAELKENIEEAIKILDARQQARLLDEPEVDARLYDGFFADADKTKMSVVRAASAEELRSMELTFKDDRLRALLPLYKARNFPEALSDEERGTWEQYRERKLLGGGTNSRLAKFFARLSQLADQPELSADNRYLLEELQLWGQNIMPLQDE